MRSFDPKMWSKSLLPSTKDKMERKVREASIEGAVPEIFIAIMSEVAGFVEKDDKKKTEYLSIYACHRETCEKLLESYLEHAVLGIYGSNIQEVTDRVKIGAVLYGAWASLYPEKQKDLDEGFLLEIRDLLENTCVISEFIRTEAISDPAENLDRLLSELFPKTATYYVQEEYYKIVAAIILYLIYRKDASDVKQTKIVVDRLMKEFVLYNDLDFLIGCKKKQVQGWEDIGFMLCPDIMKIKTLKDAIPAPELIWVGDEEVSEIISEMEMDPFFHYSNTIGLLFDVYGLPNPFKETFSKEERKLVLSTIVNSTMSDTGSVISCWSFLKELEFYSPKQRDYIIFTGFLVLSMCRELEKQRKEMILFLLRQEGKPLHENARDNVTERDLLEERVKNDRLQRRLEEKQSKYKKLEEENLMLRDKVNRRESRNLALEDMIQNLKKETEQLKTKLEKGLAMRAAEDQKTDAMIRQESRTVAEQMEVSLPDKEEILKAVQEYCRIHKSIVFGGSKNLKKKLLKRYPGIRLMGVEQIGNGSGALKNADLVLFRTDAMSHKEYQKVKGICIKEKIPYEYMDDVTNLEAIDRDLYRIISKHNERGGEL